MKTIKIFLFSLLFIISCDSEIKERVRIGTLEFKNSEVKGIIVDFYTSMRGAQFQVDNDYRKFLFSYKRTSNPKSLMNIVELGDSLIKPSDKVFFTIKKMNGDSFTYELTELD